MSPTTLRYEVTGRVARITLDRPARGNGITRRLATELEQCVEPTPEWRVRRNILEGTGHLLYQSCCQLLARFRNEQWRAFHERFEQGKFAVAELGSTHHAVAVVGLHVAGPDNFGRPVADDHGSAHDVTEASSARMEHDQEGAAQVWGREEVGHAEQVAQDRSGTTHGVARLAHDPEAEPALAGRLAVAKRLEENEVAVPGSEARAQHERTGERAEERGSDAGQDEDETQRDDKRDNDQLVEECSRGA